MKDGKRSPTWAPWWIYLITILPLNWARAAALPLSDVPTAATVAIALGQALVVFAIVTVVWRLANRSNRQ